MSVGGNETGLYRYPKEGESILVGDDVDDDDDNKKKTTPTYYLIGYIPSTTDGGNNFLTNKSGNPVYTIEKDALADEEALVLRYEQTGKQIPSADDGADRYSEIVFYRRETQWMSTDSNYKDVPYRPARDKDETDSAFSEKLSAAGYPKKENETDNAHIDRVMTPVFPHIDRVNIQSTGDMYHCQQVKG